jgi:hypothetical protein
MVGQARTFLNADKVCRRHYLQVQWFTWTLSDWLGEKKVEQNMIHPEAQGYRERERAKEVTRLLQTTFGQGDAMIDPLLLRVR